MQGDDVGSLVRAAASGERAAWTALVERFSGLVWATARGHRLGVADAEDVYQTTWLRLAEHIGRIKDPDRVGGWLATTARHEALRALRVGRRVTPTDEVETLAYDVDQDSPESALLASEDAADRAGRVRQLWTAFERLSGRCRELLRVLSHSDAVLQP